MGKEKQVGGDLDWLGAVLCVLGCGVSLYILRLLVIAIGARWGL